jgi:tolkin protein
MPLGRFCGSNRIQNPIVTGNSRMLISFMISDKGTKYQGFTASYEGL